MERKIEMKSHRFIKEYYFCNSCDTQFNIEELLGTTEPEWRCPKCNKHLDIYARLKDWKIVVQRKFPNELKKGDDIHVFGYQFSDIHEIKNISKNKKGYTLSLEGHGPFEIKEDVWVNVHEGTWSPNTTKIDLEK